MNNDRFKFRAWDKIEGKMIKVGQWNIGSHLDGTFPGGGTAGPENDYVIMQSTGLRDKNGEFIYEGDIVRLKGWIPANQEVKFNRGGFCLTYPNCYAAHDIKYAEYTSEIIGNIYENPELLTPKP